MPSLDRSDPLADELIELLDRAGADRATARRRRERSLTRQAAESATLAGALVDLAERHAVVRITLTGGRAHTGRLLAVGDDVAVLEVRAGRRVAVAVAAIAAVTGGPAVPLGVASGDRPSRGVCLVDVLGDLAGGDGPVVVGTTAGVPYRAEVVAVGVDVLAVRGWPGEAAVSYVPVAAVTDVVVGP